MLEEDIDLQNPVKKGQKTAILSRRHCIYMQEIHGINTVNPGILFQYILNYLFILHTHDFIPWYYQDILLLVPPISMYQALLPIS